MSDDTSYLLTVLGIIIGAIVFFSLFKGVIRMLLLAIAIIGAIAVWLTIQRNGFTFLSFITASPQPWMVQVASWGLALFTFLVFFHGMTWFSQLFSLRKFSPTSIITTILMSGIMLWVASIGISYYGDISRIAHFRELALAQAQGTPAPDTPFSCRVKEVMRSSSITGWLRKIDPMEDMAQVNLACLVAFGCSLEEPLYTAFYQQQLAGRGIPQGTRLLALFGDPGLRKLVQDEHFVTLLENERLKTFLQYKDTQQYFVDIL